MFASLIIISFSVLLFLYWFRYSCLLILSTKTTRDYALEVASANRLELPRIQATLQSAVPAEDLEGLQHSLDRDYRLITGLLRHAAEFRLGGVSLEERMLMIDFQIMRLSYRAACRLSQFAFAQKALEEMADIVSHFANAIGERSAVASR
ncbi:MAG: hypothetical protein NZV14_13080 [Bryobacteraceae bacterium]|nr:hypothetical protein [Bryobacteraceae bacterium]MDW8379089.1 hypothetical protein [Bryobacterales bacterium]